jgi:hypothetical protein
MPFDEQEAASDLKVYGEGSVLLWFQEYYLEMRVAASDLRLSLTLGDVRPSTSSSLESA